jgi:hypothetical protein
MLARKCSGARIALIAVLAVIAVVLIFALQRFF